MTDHEVIVAIVDDDPSIRDGVSSLLRSAGWRVETFASAEEFLARSQTDPLSCLLVDLQLPELSGLDLQNWMIDAKLEIPIVFISGHGTIPASVQAIKAGAVEFLTKPFDEQQLFHAISEAVELDRGAREHRAELRQLRVRYDSLTPREQEVMREVVSGLLNKQVASELDISEFTVKVHRGQVMRKMHADS
ncbi:MAG TPA: response regulator, partial [Dongiaceae bacterium]|nr:response regulator [Dongiaceae bacterium]